MAIRAAVLSGSKVRGRKRRADGREKVLEILSLPLSNAVNSVTNKRVHTWAILN